MNLSMMYCPAAKMSTMAVNSAKSEYGDPILPAEVATPTIELSTITAKTMTIMTTKMVLLPILSID